jgi:hypothetical protein
VLAVAGTALFQSRPDFFPIGPITCKQETQASYYCYVSGGTGPAAINPAHFFVSISNGFATWTAVSESGGGLWSGVQVAMTPAP